MHIFCHEAVLCLWDTINPLESISLSQLNNRALYHEVPHFDDIIFIREIGTRYDITLRFSRMCICGLFHAAIRAKERLIERGKSGAISVVCRLRLIMWIEFEHLIWYVIYHVNGDFADFGWAMALSEGLDALLLLGNFFSENLLQVRRVWRQLTNKYRGAQLL